jgi:hypothetical protein
MCGEPQAIPLPESERGLWTLTHMNEGASRVYNESITLVLRGPLDVAGQDRRGALRVSLDRLDQLGPGVLRGEAGDPFEHPAALLLEVEELGAALLEGGLGLGELLGALLEVALLEIEPLLALGEPVLAALDVVALLLEVLVQVVLAPGHALTVDEQDGHGGHGERDDDPEDED